MTGQNTAAADPPPGAQAERTRLSWIRTSVAVIIGSVLALRVTVGSLGAAAVVVTGICSLAAAMILVASYWRYRRAAVAMDAITTESDLPDGRLPALFGGIVVTLGILVVAYSAVG